MLEKMLALAIPALMSAHDRCLPKEMRQGYRRPHAPREAPITRSVMTTVACE
jgi:hypothetical protein